MGNGLDYDEDTRQSARFLLLLDDDLNSENYVDSDTFELIETGNICVIAGQVPHGRLGRRGQPRVVQNECEIVGHIPACKGSTVPQGEEG